MSYEHLSDKKLTVRKQHCCNWCGEIICIGEQAHYRAYKYEGDFQTDYMHLECSDGMSKSMEEKDLREDLLDFGFEPGAQFRGGLLSSREAAAWNERYGRKGAIPHDNQ